MAVNTVMTRTKSQRAAKEKFVPGTLVSIMKPHHMEITRPIASSALATRNQPPHMINDRDKGGYNTDNAQYTDGIKEDRKEAHHAGRKQEGDIIDQISKHKITP